MGDLLGARYDDARLLDEDGRVDFDKVFLQDGFLGGIDRLRHGLSMGFNVCLMCSEIKAITCHRFGMISQFLSLNYKDIQIEHISKISYQKSENLDDFELISNALLEHEILKIYFGEGLNLYGTPDDLKTAYKLHNKKIGYRPRK